MARPTGSWGGGTVRLSKATRWPFLIWGQSDLEAALRRHWARQTRRYGIKLAQYRYLSNA